MGYLPKFENDLFISYRHIDNENYRDPDLKWIEKFHSALGARLTHLVGDVKIWRDDPNIRAGDDFRKAIATALDATAVFLAVMSRTYMDSEECMAELDRFLGNLKQATDELPRKIVPVFKHPPKPEQKLPPELANLDRVDFFEWLDLASDRFVEFYPDDSNPAAPKFWSTMERLVEDLRVYLETLKGRANQGALGKVYLAHTGPDLNNYREALRTELQQRGFLALPKTPLLWNSSDLRENLVSCLEAAELCIHLVARSSQGDANGQQKARLQLELACSAMKKKSKHPPMVWIRPALQTDAGTDDLLIKYIKEELCNEGVEYCEGSLEAFKTHIYDQLNLATRRASNLRIADTREVALIVERGDKAAAAEMRRFLVQKTDREPILISFSGERPEDPSLFADGIKRCSQCIICWGTTEESWVQRLLIEDSLARRYGEKSLCIYLLAPASDDKLAFVTRKAAVIDGTSGVNTEKLQNFVA